MSNQITIGPAVRRRRRENGWGLQKLCDEVDGSMYPGHLSDIETGKSNPGVDKAHAIARALRTTIDILISESQQESPATAPVELVSQVPVIPWSQAAQWAKDPDIARLPPDATWEMPLGRWSGQGFYMRLLDDSMQAPGGVSFVEGSLIYVTPTADAQAGDYIVGYATDPTMPTFKRLVTDGNQQYLRPLNPQYRIEPLAPGFTMIGVVTGCVLKVARGFVL